MKLVDLTMPLNERTPVFPGSPKPSFKRVAYVDKDGYNAHRICTNTHFGTHIDSPWHMLRNGKRLTDFSIERFIGQAILYDVRGQREIDIELKDVKENDIVIFRTDHTKKAYASGFFETAPVISRKLAEELVERRVNIVGIDSFTLDEPPCDIHKLFFRQEILILENLVELGNIPVSIFKIYVFPIKYDRIDGAPCRVIAQIE
jgi:kynurenine formamidase